MCMQKCRYDQIKKKDKTMKGGIDLWFGIVALVIFGFAALAMSTIFGSVIGSYDSFNKMIIIAIIPVTGIILLYSVFGR